MDIGRRTLGGLAAGLVRPGALRAQPTLTAPAKPWDATLFDVTARGRTLPGIAIRLPGSGDAEGEIFSVCRICTHQGCVFGYETDYRVVGNIVDTRLVNPVLFCRCHLSVYDPAQGGRVLFGPAPRPPWRIAAREDAGALVIGAVEDGAGEYGSG